MNKTRTIIQTMITLRPADGSLVGRRDAVRY